MLTTTELIVACKKYGLLNKPQIAKLIKITKQHAPSSDRLLAEMIKQQWLTHFQAEQIQARRAADLVLDNTYSLLRILGEGRLGTVYRAKELQSEKACALKVMHCESMTHKRAVQRFYDHLGRVASLNHPNLIQVYDAQPTNGAPHYFVMELIEGQDLGQLLHKHGKLPMHQATDVVRQAALGLQYVHEQGLVHGAVKPSNLLKPNNSNVVKLLDLGLVGTLAWYETDGTVSIQPDALMGDLDFIAPEQARNGGDADIRADVYSLGSTLYTLLTGQAPFRDARGAAKIAFHLRERPQPISNFRSDVPDTLLGVVARMLAKSPDERQQTPQEVADELAPFCQSTVHRCTAKRLLKPGDGIGLYTVLAQLGEDGQGNVYLCKHERLRRRVALKVLCASAANFPEALDRLFREARALASLDHPNVIHAYDLAQRDEFHFLVLEHVEGSSIQDIIRRTGSMDPLRVAHYVGQAALGLQYLHKAGFVHCDVKPGHLLLDRTGVIKILDLGLACHSQESGELTKGIDIRSDVYSLGATCYFMLTGQPPFTSDRIAQRPKPITAFRQDVPEGLITVCENMMAEDRQHRYQRPIDVVEALAPWTATPIPPPPDIEMPQSRSEANDTENSRS